MKPNYWVEEVIEKDGLIIMVDYLGMRSRTIESAHKNFQQLHSMTNLLNMQLNSFSNSLPWFDFDLFLLGDTYITAISYNDKIDEETKYYKEIGDYGLLIREFIYPMMFLPQISLLTGLLARGAVSVGKFLIGNMGNTLLGPAMSDAASYYEKAQWIGINLTENTGNNIERSSCSRLSDCYKKKELIKYNVPYDEGKSKALWSVGWSYTMPVYLHHLEKIPPIASLRMPSPEGNDAIWIEMFEKTLIKVSQPNDDRTWGKIRNTMDFLKYCQKA